MKTLLCLTIFLILSVASASPYKTQDSLRYNITITEKANFRACATKICQISRKYSTGSCSVYARIGIVSAYLTTYGVELVEKLNCAYAIEEDQPVEAQPRVGRQN